MEAGVYFRYNPLARGMFVLYLTLLHVWTFALLVFHVHTNEETYVTHDVAGPGSLVGAKSLQSP